MILFPASVTPNMRTIGTVPLLEPRKEEIKGTGTLYYAK